MQPDIGIGLASESFADWHHLMVGNHLASMFDHVAGEVSLFGVGATLEAAGKLNQFGGGHSGTQRILSGSPDLAFDGYDRRINLVQISLDEDAILRGEKNIVLRVA